MANFGRGNDEGGTDLGTSQAAADLHNHDDVDSGPRAHHHTIGTGLNQAGSGADLAQAQQDISTNTANISALQALVNAMVPVGTIWPCGGAAPSADWLILNGSTFSGTTYPQLQTYLGGSTTLPDARDRTLVGASATKALLSTGGAATHTLTSAEIAHTHGITGAAAHNHTITAGGGHNHGFAAATIASNTNNTGTANRMTGGGTTDTQTDHAHGGNTGSDGAHDHGGVVGAAVVGSPTAFSTQDPYLAVNYMIKAR